MITYLTAQTIIDDNDSTSNFLIPYVLDLSMSSLKSFMKKIEVQKTTQEISNSCEIYKAEFLITSTYKKR